MHHFTFLPALHNGYNELVSQVGVFCVLGQHTSLLMSYFHGLWDRQRSQKPVRFSLWDFMPELFGQTYSFYWGCTSFREWATYNRKFKNSGIILLFHIKEVWYRQYRIVQQFHLIFHYPWSSCLSALTFLACNFLSHGPHGHEGCSHHIHETGGEKEEKE